MLPRQRHKVSGKMQNAVRPKAEEAPQPPRNTLSTPIGRFVERLTYRSLALLALAVVLCAAGYFFLAAGSANGLGNGAGKSVGEALYFSVVTFTTLGYGDLAPIGWGRAVAGTEALAGLFLAALLVGKLASERQSALLLLLYTSDQQRRLSAFSEELVQIANALAGCKTLDKDAVDRCSALVSSLQAYLMFQTHQGRLADFGNGSALRQLYRSMLALLCSIAELLRRLVIDPQVEERLLNLSARIARLAAIMEPFHKNDGTARATLASIGLKKREIDEWESSAVTFRRLEQVFAVVPPKPWPKHFHKAAAARLGISPTLFRKCMNALIDFGRL